MLLHSGLPSDLYSGMRYALFALGDSSYVKYNAAGRMLFNRLKQLGAEPIMERGDGDDQHPEG